eukprot:6913485-Prymnesium_polylepis.1
MATHALQPGHRGRHFWCHGVRPYSSIFWLARVQRALCVDARWLQVGRDVRGFAFGVRARGDSRVLRSGSLSQLKHVRRAPPLSQL